MCKHTRPQDWMTLDYVDCGYIQMLKILTLDGDVKLYHLDVITQFFGMVL